MNSELVFQGTKTPGVNACALLHLDHADCPCVLSPLRKNHRALWDQNADSGPPTKHDLNADLCCAKLLLTPSFRKKCGFPAIFHAIAAPVNRDDLGMMQEPVEQGSGQDFIIQEFSPFAKAGVTGKNN